MSEQSADWKSRGQAGVYLQFIVHEGQKHGSSMMHDWLLMAARKLGIPGGSAFHGIAGYGRKGVLHEQHFFELAGDLPVEVHFVCSEAQAASLLDQVKCEGLSLFYVLSSVRYGVVGAPA